MLNEYEYEYINKDDIDIYKGNFFNSNKSKNVKKVIVFDLDETLGSFADVDILWNTIKDILRDNNIISFYHLLELFPEFLRKGIKKILNFVYKKKKSGECYKLYIYTNNQSQTLFVSNIIDYFTKKIATNNDILFDQIIYAFKINNQIIQIGRTTHKKTHNDLINCTLLPKKTAICFIDDYEFDEMKKERIYYIQPTAYQHGLSTYDIIKRLFNSTLGILLNDYKSIITDQYITRCMKHNIFKPNNERTFELIEYHENISKKIMYHLKDFFILTKKKCKTHKLKKTSNSFTRKNKIN